jgi:diguanylate cyclase (GGDEF)-like protein/PAS domain S-box-containing protein
MDAIWADARRGWRWFLGACFAAYVCLSLLFGEEQPLWAIVLVTVVNVGVFAAFALLLERMRKALREQRACEQRYERAARGASDGLIEWQIDRGAMYFSERFCEMLGYRKAELAPSVDTWFGLVHPDDLTELRGAIIAHREGLTLRLEHEHRLRSADGGYLWVLVRGVVASSEGVELLSAWISDISARKQAEHELRFHAFRDPLTSLPNRSLFMDRLAQALIRVRDRQVPLRGAGRSSHPPALLRSSQRPSNRPSQPPARHSSHPPASGRGSQPPQLGVTRDSPATGGRLAVLLIDLDRFKRVNDSLGHSAGDGLLLAIADRLRGCVRAEDTVARLGGDEFALLLSDISSEADAVKVAMRVRDALLEPVIIKGRAMISGCSIGIVVAGPECDSPTDLIRDADTAMYRGKAQGRGQWAIFDPTMRERAVERLTLENELRVALTSCELEVHYQPIVDGAGNFAGFEALPRWNNPRLGMLLPGEFIALAEETGLIMDLGDRVLGEACAMGRQVLEAVGNDHPFTVHVNLSPKQIRRADLASRIDALLEVEGFDPSRLCIEVTEDLILEEAGAGGALLEELRKKGIKLCMDDFGTGYSSLSYLHRFRVDFLKIETAFVHGAETREGGVQIVRSLVNLARNLGVVAIAEGVETERQWAVLHGLGCPRAQGFFIARPLTGTDLLAWLSQQRAACA